MNYYRIQIKENNGKLSTTSVPCTAFGSTTWEALKEAFKKATLGAVVAHAEVTTGTILNIAAGTGGFDATPTAGAQRGSRWLVSGLTGTTPASFTIACADATNLTLGSDTLPLTHANIADLVAALAALTPAFTVESVKFRNYTIQ